MRKTSLTIDDEVLAQAREILGTEGIKDTIDAALREVLRADTVRRHSQRMRDGRGFDRELITKAWYGE